MKTQITESATTTIADDVSCCLNLPSTYFPEAYLKQISAGFNSRKQLMFVPKYHQDSISCALIEGEQDDIKRVFEDNE